MMTSLTTQFFQAVKDTQSSFTEKDENRNLARAIELQKRIERRLARLRAEVEALEKAERSFEYHAVERAAQALEVQP